MASPTFDARFVGQLDLLMRWRRDVRHFRRDPIPAADLLRRIETAALAPSVGNAQPWRFVGVRSPARCDALAGHVDAASALAAEQIVGAERREQCRSLKLHGLRDAPEVLAVFSDDDPRAGHDLGPATMPETLRYSTVMAIHDRWLSARARGLGVGWVPILDPIAVATMLEVPESWTPIAVLCIGYPVQPSDVLELERRDWQAREPVSTVVLER